MSSERYVVSIVEQPAKTHRFRYASEIDASRSVGSIPGANDRPDNRTYPTIRVKGYRGPMLVMLSLVNPHNKLVHPHAIGGKDSCRRNDKRYFKNGVMFVYTSGPEVSFNNIGILCVRGKSKEDIEAALRLRKDFKIDPFKKGFPQIEKHELINFAAVRFCFEVFLPAQELAEADRFNYRMYTQQLDAVLSDIVYDIKKLTDLKIVHLLDCVDELNNLYCTGSMRGGTKMILLCEKFKDPPPEVVFMEPGWMANAHILIQHKKVALVFQTPPYRDAECSQSVQVEVYLQKINAEGVMEHSNSVQFMYIPDPRAKKRPPSYSEYLDSKFLKKTLLQEYFDGKVPYPQPAAARPKFVEIPPPKQDTMGASPTSFAAQSQPLDCWQQPSTSNNPFYWPQPTHLLNTHTNTYENDRPNQIANEPNHENLMVNYVTPQLNRNINYQASTSIEENGFFNPDYSRQDSDVLQNSVALDVMPNVVSCNLLSYDQTQDVMSGANGGEIKQDFLQDEGLIHLCNALVDIKDQHPFVSDADAQTLSEELKNLQF